VGGEFTDDGGPVGVGRARDVHIGALVSKDEAIFLEGSHDSEGGRIASIICLAEGGLEAEPGAVGGVVSVGGRAEVGSRKLVRGLGVVEGEAKGVGDVAGFDFFPPEETWEDRKPSGVGAGDRVHAEGGGAVVV